MTRVMLILTNGGVAPESLGWAGHVESTAEVFREISKRESWLTRTEQMPWAALLVSEQTRQFYAHKDIAERFLPHVFGTFRAAQEERLPLNLINDWDLTTRTLSRYRVLVLANAAALSDAQAQEVRDYVEHGGGLVATAETSLCDALGRPRHDFALSDLFGVKYQGRPKAPERRPELDVNFAVTVDEDYWKQRTGVATLSWDDHPLVRDLRLNELVPHKSVTFKGPLVQVSAPADPKEIALRMTPEGSKALLPAAVLRKFGEGRVAYFAAGLDAALWSYAYPYQRRLLCRALEWAADKPFPISVTAPMCVQTTFFTQTDKSGRRVVMHFFNGGNTTANHGLPATDVPLREEVVAVHGIRVRFEEDVPKSFHVEPGGLVPRIQRADKATIVEMPPLEIHSMLVGES
jgi:type 1 glutamine amidotransferase